MKQLYSLFIVLFIFSCKSANESVKPFNIEEEKAKIIAVLDKEAKSYREKNFEVWKSTYVHQPYNTRMGFWEGYENGIKHVQGWDNLLELNKSRFNGKRKSNWDDSTTDQEVLSFRIYKDVAWLSYKQKDFEAHTNKLIGDAIGSVIMEKEDQGWKIANLCYFYYPMDQT